MNNMNIELIYKKKQEPRKKLLVLLFGYGRKSKGAMNNSLDITHRGGLYQLRLEVWSWSIEGNADQRYLQFKFCAIFSTQAPSGRTVFSLLVMRRWPYQGRRPNPPKLAP